jgi:hypothetical protein
MEKFNKAIELFDAYNKQDPNKLKWEGEEYPAEYFYALQLYNWVKKLRPQADMPLLLASRSQHIGRWKIPRSQYPLGKAGYLRWRSELARFHAATAEDLLHQAGYNDSEINKVKHILLKQNLKTDDEVQIMENALCLVFLEFQLEDFILKHDVEKLVRILQKTWKKMSEPGRQAALNLGYSSKAKSLLDRALEG